MSSHDKNITSKIIGNKVSEVGNLSRDSPRLGDKEHYQGRREHKKQKKQWNSKDI